MSDAIWILVPDVAANFLGAAFAAGKDHMSMAMRFRSLCDAGRSPVILKELQTWGRDFRDRRNGSATSIQKSLHSHTCLPAGRIVGMDRAAEDSSGKIDARIHVTADGKN